MDVWTQIKLLHLCGCQIRKEDDDDLCLGESVAKYNRCQCEALNKLNNFFDTYQCNKNILLLQISFCILVFKCLFHQ